jgi:tetratricopeptide (TPR) repeat protein
MPPKNKKKKKASKTPEQKAEAAAKRAQANRAANLEARREPTPRELAEEAKEEGNSALAAGDLPTAISHYTQAIQHDHGNHVYWSNRSAALLKSGNIKGAISDGEMCIEVNPTWAKGYSRLGAALYAKGELAEAQKIYKQGLEYAAPHAAASRLRTHTRASAPASPSPSLCCSSSARELHCEEIELQ